MLEEMFWVGSCNKNYQIKVILKYKSNPKSMWCIKENFKF